MRIVSSILLGLMASATVHALPPSGMSAPPDNGLGLTASADGLPWSRWQGRLSLGMAAPVWRSGLFGFETSGLKPAGISMMGDYYFTGSMSGTRSVGGFRATSGVVIGPRSQWWGGQPGAGAGSAWSAEQRLLGPAAALSGNVDSGNAGKTGRAIGRAGSSYVGLGYTELSQRGDWSFSADLGLLASTPSNSLRFGRAGGNGITPDDASGDTRVAPVLQLGVSRSF